MVAVEKINTKQTDIRITFCLSFAIQDSKIIKLESERDVVAQEEVLMLCLHHVELKSMVVIEIE